MAEPGGLAVQAPDRRRAAALVVVVVLLALVLFSGPLTLGDGVPEAIRRQVEDNGEASTFALLMIAPLTEPLASRSIVRRAWWTSVVGALILTSSVGHWIDLPGWAMTLREPFAAAAIVAIYLRLPVTYRRRGALYLVVAVATIVSEFSLVAIGHSWPAAAACEHAETVGMFLLMAVVVDVLRPQPGLLGRPAPSWARVGWCVALAAAALALMVAYPDGVASIDETSTAPLDHLRLWALRNVESLIAVLIVSVWLFSVGSSADSAASPERRGRTCAAPETAAEPS